MLIDAIWLRLIFQIILVMHIITENILHTSLSDFGMINIIPKFSGKGLLTILKNIKWSFQYLFLIKTVLPSELNKNLNNKKLTCCHY